MVRLMQTNSTNAYCYTSSVMALAEGNKTNPVILEKLATHSDPNIRAAVADNPRAPHAALMKLARDESEDIRFQLAENHNIPILVLFILAEDANPYISCRAEQTLHRLSFGDMSFAI